VKLPKRMLAWGLAAAALISFEEGILAQSNATVVKHGQPCWVIESDQMELAITELGGHMAPVVFYRNDPSPVEPYYISPWQSENHTYPVPVLAPLRGDFFCMPFGGNSDPYQSEQHLPHGETAGSKWTLKHQEKFGKVTQLALELTTTVRPGRVTKTLQLVDGHNVVYSNHHIDGFLGRTPLGHHATLGMPDVEGAFKISHSPIRFGITNPTQFSDPAKGEYQQLAINQRFQSLTEVPSRFKDASDVDVSRLPQSTGYADLVALITDDNKGKPAWLTAVEVEKGWLWFSLKDPKILTMTVFWLENHGRHQLPWFGRNNCVGFEDVTAYFADGIRSSTEENQIAKAGVATAHDLKGAFDVRYIQGVAKTPPGFKETADVEFGTGTVTFVSTTGQRVEVPVAHDFLKTGDLSTFSK
jgi:hypothetical protein